MRGWNKRLTARGGRAVLRARGHERLGAVRGRYHSRRLPRVNRYASGDFLVVFARRRVASVSACFVAIVSVACFASNYERPRGRPIIYECCVALW